MLCLQTGIKKLMYNRFFTFGCSYTNFIWPTWADIIAKDLDIDHQNWGRSGSGNRGIQSRFVEANNIHAFNESDLVIIQWSGWNREDRYVNDWRFVGNIFNNKIYDKKFIKRHWSYEDDLIKNSVIIKTTNDAYLDKLNYQFSFGTQIQSSGNKSEYDEYNWAPSIDKTNKTDQIIQSYCMHLPNIEHPEVTNNKFDNQCMDTHPDVIAHIEIVEKYIYPVLFQHTAIKDETRKLFLSYHNDMSAVLSPNDTWQSMDDKAAKINKKYNLKIGRFSEYYGI